MAFTREHLYAIRRDKPCQVGQLPDSIWHATGWQCPYVYLGTWSLEHIAKKHSDVSEFDMLLIPLAVAQGTVVLDPADPRRLIIAYRTDDAPEKVYRCVLKEARLGTEIWVSTFHRIDPAQLAGLLRKGTILREQRERC